MGVFLSRACSHSPPGSRLLLLGCRGRAMESDSSSRSLELDSRTLSRSPVGLFPKRVSQFSFIHKKQVWGRISESHTDWKWLSERDKIMYLVRGRAASVGKEVAWTMTARSVGGNDCQCGDLQALCCFRNGLCSHWDQCFPTLSPRGPHLASCFGLAGTR